MFKFITKERIIFSIVCICFGLLGLVLGTVLAQRSCESKEEIVAQISTLEPSTRACDLYVDVSGAVNKPNVYCLKGGDLLIDAIKEAGGFKSDKYASKYVSTNINLAQKLQPNEKIYIPFSTEAKCEYINIDPLKQKVLGSSCISINSGSIDQLDTLNGVGQATATKIVQGRPYKKLEDLLNVSGVGESLFEKIKNQICL